MIAEIENRQLNVNDNLLYGEINEVSIINEEKYILFDLSENKVIKKYSRPPIFKRLGKYFTKRRRDNKDLMRKRIKSNFYKEMKNKLNKKLKKLNIKEKLDWPQDL